MFTIRFRIFPLAILLTVVSNCNSALPNLDSRSNIFEDFAIGDDQTTPAAKQYKDPQEYFAISQIKQATNPSERLQLLASWARKYPSTDFVSERFSYFVATLKELAANSPTEGPQLVEQCRELLKSDPTNFQANYSVSLYGPALGGEHPSAEFANMIETAATAISKSADDVFAASKIPPSVTPEAWRQSKLDVKAAGQKAIAWVASKRQEMGAESVGANDATYFQAKAGGSSPAPLPSGNASRYSVDGNTIPGRISSDQLKAVLAADDSDTQKALADLLAHASNLSNTLLRIQQTHFKHGTPAGVQQIRALQQRLGNSLQPSQLSDVVEMNELLYSCFSFFSKYTLPPGYSDVYYTEKQAIDSFEHDQQRILQAQRLIRVVESDFDKGDLTIASHSYNSLATYADVVSIKLYLKKTVGLNMDLQSLKEVRLRPAVTGLIDEIHEVAALESLSSRFSVNPLTLTYLQTTTMTAKRSLKQQIDSLPTFHLDPRLYPIKFGDHPPSLETMKASLAPFVTLSILLNDPEAINYVKTWFGEATSSVLLNKGNGLKTAQEVESAVAEYMDAKQVALERAQRAHEQEVARLQEAVAEEARRRQALRAEDERRRAALIEEKASIAHTIVNQALMITMLEEKFQRTQIMGYSMEADKQASALATSLHDNRAILDSSVWQTVQARYQQVLPGLTVSQADTLQALLRKVRARFQ